MKKPSRKRKRLFEQLSWRPLSSRPRRRLRRSPRHRPSPLRSPGSKRASPASRRRTASRSTSSRPAALRGVSARPPFLHQSLRFFHRRRGALLHPPHPRTPATPRKLSASWSSRRRWPPPRRSSRLCKGPSPRARRSWLPHRWPLLKKFSLARARIRTALPQQQQVFPPASCL